MGFTGGPWTARPTLTKGNDIGKKSTKKYMQKIFKMGHPHFFLTL